MFTAHCTCHGFIHGSINIKFQVLTSKMEDFFYFQNYMESNCHVTSRNAIRLLMTFALQVRLTDYLHEVSFPG